MPHTNTPQKILTLAIITLSFSLSLLAIPSSHLTANANTFQTSDIYPKEEKCPELFKKFPYALDVKAKKFYKVGTKPEDLTLNPKTNPSSPDTIVFYKENTIKLAATCQCLTSIPNPNYWPTVTTAATQAAWANIYLAQVCDYVQIERVTKVSAGNRTFKPCSIDPAALEASKLNIDQFRNVDTNHNCKLDAGGREKCLTTRTLIQNTCKNRATEFNFDGVKDSCAAAIQYQCIANNTKPKKIPLFDDSGQAQAISSQKTLTNKDAGQIGFIKFFQLPRNDQGAGTDNPAINLVLYIINLLAGLSFLIAVAMLILGGFYLVMASGNSEMTDKGKNAIKNFIFAITFTLLSYAIVTFIQILLYS